MNINRNDDTILGHIANIIDLSEKTGITHEFMETASGHLKSVSDYYSITPEQALLFSHFIGQGEDNNISTLDIAESLNCKPIDILIYQKDIDELVKRKLLVKRRKLSGVMKHGRNESSKYYVPVSIMESLKSNTPLVIQEYVNLGIYDLFDILEQLVSKCFDDEISSADFIDEVNYLIDNNLHLTFCQVFKSYRLKESLTSVFIFFCERLINNDDDKIELNQLNDLFENVSEYRYISRTFKDRTNCLFTKGLVQNTTNERFGDREAFCLTDKAKSELLVELNVDLKNAKLKKDLILADKITAKKMFYNDKTEKSVQELTSLLMPEKNKNITKRLKETGMRTGFACLFYGEPGTGKTETVNMIAKSTGRDIMVVDISQIKSCWFGESEKKIKQIFDKYRVYVEANEVAPILLLNEADAVIGKRKDVTIGSVAQTENAIQNIILQELENLNGILIATTNLTQNMDKAFERRFLYKVEFSKPAPKIREMLWKEMMPDLADNEARLLSEKFNFSGGQIENIARKGAVNFVLSGNKITVDQIIEYCHDEKLEGQISKPIGFSA